MTFQKLSKNDLRNLTGTGSRGAPKEYVDFVNSLRKGEGGSVDVSKAKASKQTVKNRLTRAAEIAGIKLKFRRSPEKKVVFEVVK